MHPISETSPSPVFRHVLVAVDFTPSFDVLRERLQRLRTLGVERATLVHVLAAGYSTVPQQTHREHYADRLRDEAAALEASGYRAGFELRSGPPATELHAAARAHGADLVLIAARANPRARQLVLGSTALEAARQATVPLWLEPARGVAPTESGVLMLGTDGSAAAAGAEALFERLRPLYRHALAVTVDGDGDGDGASAHLSALATRVPDVETRVCAGNPREALATLANELAAELVVVGRRGRGAVAGHLLGSTAEALCRHAEVPVLLAPATDEPGKETRNP